jgi:hypothetical protein
MSLRSTPTCRPCNMSGSFPQPPEPSAGGSAEADDASTVFYNPAGLTRLSGSQLEVGALYIVPRAEFKNEGSTCFSYLIKSYLECFRWAAN